MDINSENSQPGGTQSQQRTGYGFSGSAQGFTPPDREQSPSTIYSNLQSSDSPYGGEPQYHYGRTAPVINEKYYYEQQQRAKNIRTLKSSIRKSATVVGFSMALYWGLGIMFSLLLIDTRLGYLYATNSSVYSSVGMFYTAAVVFIPFFIGNLIYKKTGSTYTVNLERPGVPALKTVLLIIAAFGGCMLANFITNIIVSFGEGFGIYLETPVTPEPASVIDLLLSFFGTAILPPLIEEYAMRGVVLGNLRKYGDGFAIVASAFCFGIFHGNPSQIPFAFMCGLLLGYIAVETGSLWVSIAVHMLVNGLSCIYPLLAMVTTEENADALLSVMIYACMFAGAVAFALYLHFFKPSFAKLGGGEVKLGSKFVSFVTNPLIIIMTLVFLYEAAMNYVSLG